MDEFLKTLTDAQLSLLATAVFSRRLALAEASVARGEFVFPVGAECTDSAAKATIAYQRRTGCSVIFAKAVIDARECSLAGYRVCDVHEVSHTGRCEECD